MLIEADVAAAVGPWNETFFLYSEETDYLRRVRDLGREIWFEPESVVVHRGAGSGSSQALQALMAVNRARYAQMHMDGPSAWMFRWIVAGSEAARSYDRDHRYTLRYLINRERWNELPQSSMSSDRHDARGTGRGSVVIPRTQRGIGDGPHIAAARSRGRRGNHRGDCRLQRLR